MTKRRVVVTGLGVVTSLGETVDGMWDNVCAGKSGIGPITRWDPTAFTTRFGGECSNFDLTKYDISKYSSERLQPKRLDRFGQFGIAASINAVVSSGLDFNREDRTRCGVIIGSGIGGIETLEEQNKILVSRGVSRVSPFTVPRLMVNAASGNVSIIFGLQGPNTAVATACATGANAIGDAGRLIQHDLAEVMVAGGSEAALCELGLGAFCAARALSTRNDDPPHASRPWDKDRDGFVMGEGAGVVILEEYEHAKKRGAKIHCELIGYGMSADAFHITAPDENGTGASRAMALALRDGRINPDQVDYINAHGTSTPLGDLAETKALKNTFGPHAKKMAISSTKSELGHLLGASGGVEAVITAMTIERNLIPPTINLDHPDEGCDLDFVPHKARDRRVQIALSNSFGFGGHNACLLFQKSDRHVDDSLLWMNRFDSTSIMAFELLRIVAGLLVLIVPGVLLAGWLRLGNDELARWTFGGALGLALAVYLASSLSHFDLRIFYPVWGALAAVATWGRWRFGQDCREKTPRWIWLVLLAVAASRLALALPQLVPNGWDPTFHLILARKIQLTQHSISDWLPFESAALNYPTGSHTLLVILSAITRLPLETVFKDLLPLLGVPSTAAVYLLARAITADAKTSLFSAAAYGIWAFSGSIEYWRWGGLPNELAMFFLIAMLALWLDQSDGKRRWILMGIFYAALILTHHHVMLASFAILAAALACTRGDSRRVLLKAILFAAALDIVFLSTYIAHIPTLNSTYALTNGEAPVQLAQQVVALGIPLVVFATLGLLAQSVRRSKIVPLIPACCVALAVLFVAGEYLWPAILHARGQSPSTAFTPSRFLADMNYFLAVLAGMALARGQMLFKIPTAAMFLLMALCAASELHAWRAVAAPPQISADYIAACRWVSAHTPPSTVVLNDDPVNQNPWTTSFCWRRAGHTPMPTSEPWADARPQAQRAPKIMKGELPPDAPDMWIVAIDQPGKYPDKPVLWRDPGGLAVIQLWSANGQ